MLPPPLPSFQHYKKVPSHNYTKDGSVTQRSTGSAALDKLLALAESGKGSPKGGRRNKVAAAAAGRGGAATAAAVAAKPPPLSLQKQRKEELAGEEDIYDYPTSSPPPPPVDRQVKPDSGRAEMEDDEVENIYDIPTETLVLKDVMEIMGNSQSDLPSVYDELAKVPGTSTIPSVSQPQPKLVDHAHRGRGYAPEMQGGEAAAVAVTNDLSGRRERENANSAVAPTVPPVSYGNAGPIASEKSSSTSNSPPLPTRQSGIPPSQQPQPEKSSNNSRDPPPPPSSFSSSSSSAIARGAPQQPQENRPPPGGSPVFYGKVRRAPKDGTKAAKKPEPLPPLLSRPPPSSGAVDRNGRDGRLESNGQDAMYDVVSSDVIAGPGSESHTHHSKHSSTINGHSRSKVEGSVDHHHHPPPSPSSPVSPVFPPVSPAPSIIRMPALSPKPKPKSGFQFRRSHIPDEAHHTHFEKAMPPSTMTTPPSTKCNAPVPVRRTRAPSSPVPPSSGPAHSAMPPSSSSSSSTNSGPVPRPRRHMTDAITAPVTSQKSKTLDRRSIISATGEASDSNQYGKLASDRKFRSLDRNSVMEEEDGGYDKLNSSYLSGKTRLSPVTGRQKAASPKSSRANPSLELPPRASQGVPSVSPRPQFVPMPGPKPRTQTGSSSSSAGGGGNPVPTGPKPRSQSHIGVTTATGSTSPVVPGAKPRPQQANGSGGMMPGRKPSASPPTANSKMIASSPPLPPRPTGNRKPSLT